MWDILRLPCQRVHAALCIEKKYETILKLKSIIIICRLTCAYWIPYLKTSGYKLVWVVGMVLRSPIRYPLVESIWHVAWINNLEIILAHGNNIFLEFHWPHWLVWLLALDKDIWLAYNWHFQLYLHLNLQILELWVVLCLHLCLTWSLVCFL